MTFLLQYYASKAVLIASHKELFLSPRTLHFTNLQLYWQCKTTVKCGSPRCNNPSTAAGQLFVEGRLLPNIYTEDNSSKLYGSHGLQLWYRLAGDYSRSFLTRAEDKINAFDGVVQHFRQLRAESTGGEEYVAGLWMSNFWTDLLWYPIDGPSADYSRDFQGRGTFKDSSDKPSHLEWQRQREPYIAPSWSWFSITGPISWDFPTQWGLLSEYENFDWIPCSQIIEKECVFDRHRLYAGIFIEALSFTIKIRRGRLYLADLNEESSPISFLYDEPESRPLEGEYLCIASICVRGREYLQRGIFVSEATAEENANLQGKVRLQPGSPSFVRRGVWISASLGDNSSRELLAQLYQKHTTKRRILVI